MLAPLAFALVCSGLPAGGGHFLLVGRGVPPAKSGLPTLKYTEMDVQNMREVGERLFCFQPDQITVLTGANATAERVLATLAALTPKVRGDAGRLGRLFVYISAHGSQVRGVLLDQDLPAPALFEAIAAVGAQQTFSFLDTCESATMNGLAKGTLGLAPGWDEGYFHLAASAGITFENPQLRGGEATQNFLSAIYHLAGASSPGPVHSTDLCRYLHRNRLGSLGGGCTQRFQGGEGIVLVPDRRPPGRLAVEVVPGSGPWQYLLAPLRQGRPVGGFPARTTFRGEQLGLPPGAWQVQRVHGGQGSCDVAQVEIASGRTATVREADWGPDNGYCPAVERAERRSAEPAGRSLAWSVGGAFGEGVARVGLSQYAETRGRLGVALQAGLRSVTRLGGGDSPIRELALVGSWDPYLWSHGELDTLVGFELIGGARLQPGAPRPMGAGAVRMAWQARVTRGWQPELVSQVGARAGLSEPVTLWLGLAVGVHHAF